MSSDSNSISSALSQTTPVLRLRVWVLIAIGIGILMAILFIIALWLSMRRKKKTAVGFDGRSHMEIPIVSKDINVDRVDAQSLHDSGTPIMPVQDKYEQMKGVSHLAESRSVDVDAFSQCSSVYNIEKAGSSYSEDYSSSGPGRKGSSSYGYASASPLVGLPELSHLGWGHWFTLRDLEYATNRFAKSNVLGEGGYGIVYKGRLMNGTEVAVKKILNNVGQAEKEFRVEVEAIGHVRHKNLVRLLGYCVEGIHRMLVYEYVNNGNLEQWLHGAMSGGILTWENRMKILLGTAKALAYLHEAIDPKVVHRDIKSSNILIDDEFNSKVSDFGLAKLLNSDSSYINTRVMGTYGYVAPEYANSGMLNEKSDIYSFGVVLLESVTARDPVDYSKPADETNLVEWLKMMISSKRAEEVVDPNLEIKPPKRALKRAILVGLKCVDPDADKRPKMSHVVQMLEAVQNAYRQDQKRPSSQMGSVDVESQQSAEEISNSADS
ncbi:S-receptor kinase homolog precursor-like [Oryza sativa Japonica Group]|uniref:non-specific serine/threonine protein kinase n=7 Tax=Oryza TaxID=4527 RepID=A2ZWA0_ORYSJ|nr:probable receptor-like protein kinase At2g42960 [Oryza sativa Japonica Group]EAY75276.1 hypothetical protein OsI_03163 [Oryza sativa Indica Group]KAB8082812.1 hypothetical protein EE612_004828 [Oryza sativa]EAZ12997.1 hypothetical protein OsJ_02917 [Oryza sativa Japonica Group]KAB8082813.1 hypothetical protein EE612_004828 [Oryza sativa]KAF2951544.1 hypothetical protein DAI22_01g270700 [Oryza sativa Japonica Group]|eukprot:NP_001043791.1 Os01g0664200 [Oryza sativa Japonica Group]